MLKDIVEARPVSGYRIHLCFEDGVDGEVDLSDWIRFKGVYEPLKDPARFSEFRVNAELGTICWPNGAELDPDVLYSSLNPATASSLIWTKRTKGL